MKFNILAWNASVRRQWIIGILSIAIAVGRLWACVTQDGGSHPLETFFEDDFYYYATIGQNIIHEHWSTFDHVTTTNGYQPLWMAVIIACELAFGSHGAAFLLSVTVLSAALVALGAGLLTRFLDEVARDSGWPDDLVLPAALLYAIAGVRIASNGMEVALLWPLLPGLLLVLRRFAVRPGPSACFGLGLLISLIALARLDAPVFLLPLGLWTAYRYFSRGEPRAALVQGALAATLGLAPLVLYLVYNQIVFDGIVPVSGLAKRLLISHGPFVSQAITRFREALGLLFIAALAVPTALGAGAALLCRGRGGIITDVYLPLILGCGLYYFSNVAFSDWIMWSWYYYGLAFTAALSLGMIGPAVVSRWPNPARPGISKLAAGLVCLLVLAPALKALISTKLDNSMLVAARELRHFQLTHPGRYAMGDRAGMVGWLMPHGVVQVEGLVSDRRQLDDIRNQVPLIASLRRQGVRYYISTDATHDHGCWGTLEPSEPGPNAPKMLGQFCQSPVLQFQVRSRYLQRPVITRVFEIS